MINTRIFDANLAAETITLAVAEGNPFRLTKIVQTLSAADLAMLFYRLSADTVGGLFAALPLAKAEQVFEMLPPALQVDVVTELPGGRAAELFAGLEPDDRGWLIDAMASSAGSELLHSLSAVEMRRTVEVLNYPEGSIGRRMNPGCLLVGAEESAAAVVERIRCGESDVHSAYTVVVVDGERRMVGVVELPEILVAEPESPVSRIMQQPCYTEVDADAVDAARRCVNSGLFALPVVDAQFRPVGVVVVDTAVRVLDLQDDEDVARQAAAEPLRRPYLSVPLSRIVRSRITWLVVLALGASLTVQVLSVFEETLEQVTVLALFIPLVIGTGGNTGTQAAATVTRALATGEVVTGDVFRVVVREFGVGLRLGVLLGALIGVVSGVVFGPEVGVVVGCTVVVVCVFAAVVGGGMPLVAQAVGADPAVFSNPFISTVVDAVGLVMYFVIASTVMGM